MTPRTHDEDTTCQEEVIYSPIKKQASLESSSVSKQLSTTTLDSSSSPLQVVVRIRPFLPSEAGSTTCVDVLPLSTNNNDEDDSTQVVRVGGTDGLTFTFDRALPHTTSQVQVYDSCVSPLVMACLEGYNATVLAYGQTGSGKTFTILGSSIQEQGIMGGEKESTLMGIIPRALRDLFCRLQNRKSGHDHEQLSLSESYLTDEDEDEDEDDNDGNETDQSEEGDVPSFEYEVKIQFLELYGEEIRDLLSPVNGQRLSICDGGNGVNPEVIGATETTVASAEEAVLCLHRGSLRRVTGATAMNAESSRSHAIMSVIIEQKTTFGGHGINEGVNKSLEVEVKKSKFHFVDLAGSERAKKTFAKGKRFKEGVDINKGLLVLGNVISALGDPKKQGKTFVPYRDSKLTRLLKGSLGGNHKTLMIACVSPSSKNMEETLNCLRYANRAKNIQNKAVANVVDTTNSRLVGELRDNVKALAAELLRVRTFCTDDDNIFLRDSPFSSDALMSMSSGNDCPNACRTKETNVKESTITASQLSSGTSRDESSIQAELKLAETEKELARVRNLLEQTKQQLDATTSKPCMSKNDDPLQEISLEDEIEFIKDDEVCSSKYKEGIDDEAHKPLFPETENQNQYQKASFPRRFSAKYLSKNDDHLKEASLENGIESSSIYNECIDTEAHKHFSPEIENQNQYQKAYFLPLRSRTHKLLIACMILFVVAIIGGSIYGIATSTKKDGSSQAKTTTNAKEIENSILLISPYATDNSTVNNPSNMALKWVTLDAEKKLDKNNTKWIQRYIMALFYYSTFGEYWLQNGSWLTEESECTWYGISCDVEGRIWDIELGNNNVTGTLPYEIISSTPYLLNLFLHNNSMTGPLPGIPDDISPKTQLRSVALEFNEFTGSVPFNWGKVLNISNLYLRDNRLNGTLPELPEYGSFEHIDLSSNNITGTLPTTMTKLANLMELHLHDNSFYGEISSSLTNSIKLDKLSLHYNQFHGTIPCAGFTATSPNITISSDCLSMNRRDDETATIHGVVCTCCDMCCSLDERRCESRRMDEVPDRMKVGHGVVRNRWKGHQKKEHHKKFQNHH